VWTKTLICADTSFNVLCSCPASSTDILCSAFPLRFFGDGCGTVVVVVALRGSFEVAPAGLGAPAGTRIETRINGVTRFFESVTFEGILGACLASVLVRFRITPLASLDRALIVVVVVVIGARVGEGTLFLLLAVKSKEGFFCVVVVIVCEAAGAAGREGAAVEGLWTVGAAGREGAAVEGLWTVDAAGREGAEVEGLWTVDVAGREGAAVEGLWTVDAIAGGVRFILCSPIREAFL